MRLIEISLLVMRARYRQKKTEIRKFADITEKIKSEKRYEISVGGSH